MVKAGRPGLAGRGADRLGREGSGGRECRHRWRRTDRFSARGRDRGLIAGLSLEAGRAPLTVPGRAEKGQPVGAWAKSSVAVVEEDVDRARLHPLRGQRGSPARARGGNACPPRPPRPGLVVRSPPSPARLSTRNHTARGLSPKYLAPRVRNYPELPPQGLRAGPRGEARSRRGGGVPRFRGWTWRLRRRQLLRSVRGER